MQKLSLKQWAQYTQTITKPFLSVSGGLCASQSLLHSQLHTVGKKEHRIRSLKAWLSLELPLNKGDACGQVSSMSLFPVFAEYI